MSNHKLIGYCRIPFWNGFESEELAIIKQPNGDLGPVSPYEGYEYDHFIVNSDYEMKYYGLR